MDNAKLFKMHTGVKLCAVVKADAYGHGAEETVNALSSVADCFAVSLLSEAIALRGVALGKEILILTPPTSIEEILCCAKNGFSFTVPSYAVAELVLKTVRAHQVCVQVHLKANIGMNRYGANASWLGRICTLLQTEKRVRVQGFYSHLYTLDQASALRAREKFVQMQQVVLRYYPNAVCHLSATHGACLGKDFAFDMVRIGLGLYGYLPSEAFQDKFPLKKAMQAYAPVTATRRYGFGGGGYGEETIHLAKGAPMHVLRFGYADGFLRTNHVALLEEEQISPLCMDASVRGGTAEFGKWRCVFDDAQKVAKQTGTIAYEVLCALGRRAERIYENE